jgi:hypothetical protein
MLLWLQPEECSRAFPAAFAKLAMPVRVSQVAWAATVPANVALPPTRVNVLIGRLG